MLKRIRGTGDEPDAEISVSETAPPTESIPVLQTAPVPQTAAVRDRPLPRSETAAVCETAPVPQTARTPDVDARAADIIASLPAVEGYLRTPNVVEDHLLPQLEPFEQIVYRRLYRLSHGYQKTPVEWADCTVSIPKIAEKTRLSEKTVQRALRGLEGRSLVVRRGIVPGTAGVVYEVRSPVLQTGAVRETGAVRKTGAVRQAANTSYKHDMNKTPDADAPAVSVYDVRTRAARIYEGRHHDPAFTAAALRAEVRAELDRDSLTVDEGTLDDAVRGMM